MLEKVKTGLRGEEYTINQETREAARIKIHSRMKYERNVWQYFFSLQSIGSTYTITGEHVQFIAQDDNIFCHIVIAHGSWTNQTMIV
jgi:hypothetical protein